MIWQCVDKCVVSSTVMMVKRRPTHFHGVKCHLINDDDDYYKYYFRDHVKNEKLDNCLT